MRLILASGSPRRAELIQMVADRIAGLKIEVVPSKVVETNQDGEAPKDYACRMAAEKADEVYARIKERDNDANAVVLGCDTVVALGSEIFGKPQDPLDAVRMLKQLSANTHEVITGVCVTGHKGRLIQSQVSRVTFKAYCKETIQQYVDTGSPLDKAGGYGLQDELAMPFITKVEGNHYNVVGLPIELVVEMLREYESWH